MARPAYTPSVEARATVTKLAELGFRQIDIAKVVEIAVKTLRKAFRKELDTAAVNVNETVVRTLLGMATSGKNTSATIFWVKTRCFLAERPKKKIKEPVKVEGPKTIEVRVTQNADQPAA